MSQGQSLATMAGTLKLLSGKWETQGVITLNGECWTHSGSESHSAEEESLSLLSGIILSASEVDNRYLVSEPTIKRLVKYLNLYGATNRGVPMNIAVTNQKTTTELIALAQEQINNNRYL
jgi:hypothetical protein